ncbi:DUF1707 domain-containing protein [Nocardia rosealba]|uniref:DUF1707 domain-containing protein n=1 Tax=Nocardia rosealba TaxID=2878563 RepID=UPI001CD92F59|nr:DUF1707 domain-containing protein [Nocardia rosealba]MCA2207714.1 DUF1707 domain-containing protein [Nocardia rosealba]
MNPRIGTIERDRALGLLNEHQAAGRIDLREFDLRAQKITAAATQADLDAIFADLPSPVSNRRNPLLLATVALGITCVVLVGAVVVLASQRSSAPANDTAAPVSVTAPRPSAVAAAPTTSRSGTSTSTSAAGSTSGALSDVSTDAVQYVMDFKPLSGGESADLEFGPSRVSGTSYSRSVLLSPYRKEMAFVEYDLGRKFTRLDGVLGVQDDSTPSDIAVQFQIYADGTLLTDVLVKLGASVPIHLEFDKPLRLRLQVTDTTGGACVGVFGDLRATR